jgi:hypothetical protein
MKFKFSQLFCSAFYSLLLLTSNIILAKDPAPIRDLQTARLLGTSGAGAGSILVTEAALLNPASIVFFRKSSIYAQTGDAEFEFDKDIRGRKHPEDGTNKMVFISDNSTSIKGGVSYQNYSELDWERSNYTLTLARPAGRSSSLGITYQYTQDKFEDDDDLDSEYHFPTFGLTHIFSEKIIIGVVVKDPGNSVKDTTTTTLGAQFTLIMNLTLTTDYSINNRLRANEKYSLKGSLQLQVAKDFYIRIGQFKDKMNDTKGHSYGISWSGPKLTIDYAQKTTNRDEEDGYLYEKEKIVEQAIGISVRF